MTWLADKDVSVAAATGRQLPGYGMSLVAAKSLAAGDQILAIPASLHISPSEVKISPVGKAIEDVLPDADDSTLLALGLLQAMGQGEEGALWPYVNMLPSADDMHVPLLWEPADLTKWLGGSHLSATVSELRESLLAEWAAIIVPALASAGLTSEVFCAEGYLWAHAIVLSRALPFGESLTLIPFLDLANHKSGATNTCSIGVATTKEDGTDAEKDGSGGGGSVMAVSEAWQLEALSGEPTAVLSASAPHESGEQIFIDYCGPGGWRSSWEMLYTYGFVPGMEPAEWMGAGGRPLFFEGVDPSDPLMQQKKAMLVSLGVDEEGAGDGVWVDVKASQEQCMGMAPLLRLSHLSEADMQAVPQLAGLASWGANPGEAWKALQAPVGKAVEKRVASQVVKACEEALEALPSAEELAPTTVGPKEGEASDEPVSRVRERLAARVVLGERAALEGCLTVWKKVLEVADDA